MKKLSLIAALFAIAGCSFGEAVTVNVDTPPHPLPPNLPFPGFQFVNFGHWSDAKRISTPIFPFHMEFTGPARGTATDATGTIPLSGSASVRISSGGDNTITLNFPGYYRISYLAQTGTVFVNNLGGIGHSPLPGTLRVSNKVLEFHGPAGQAPLELRGLLDFMGTYVTISTEFLGRR